MRSRSMAVLLAVFIAVALPWRSAGWAQGGTLPPAEFADRNDVLLIPTEEFPFEYATGLAKALAGTTKLNVRAVANLGTGEWHPYANAPQYDPAKLKDIALPAIAELQRTHGGSLFILLTARDINSASGGLRFVFAESYPRERVSVISVARLLAGPPGQQAEPGVVALRMYKMILRTIGLLYFELPRNADPKNLLFSPLMSLDALDGMEPWLRPPGVEPDARR